MWDADSLGADDAGCRLRSFMSPSLQERDLRRIPVHVEVPSLDVPALQLVEEVDVALLSFAFVEQAIVPATPEVPVASSVSRAVQPLGVQLSLRLPALDNPDFEEYTVREYLERLFLPETPEVRVPAVERAQHSLLELLRDVRDTVASGRLVFGEQVVDVPVRGRVPRGAVSGSIMEQVMDVPVLGHVHLVVSEEDVGQVDDVPGSWHAPRARFQPSTGLSAASLDYAEEPVQGFFSHLSSKKKVRRFSASRLPGSSTPAAYEDEDFWVGPAGEVWQRGFDHQYRRSYWHLMVSSHSQ